MLTLTQMQEILKTLKSSRNIMATVLKQLLSIQNGSATAEEAVAATTVIPQDVQGGDMNLLFESETRVSSVSTDRKELQVVTVTSDAVDAAAGHKAKRPQGSIVRIKKDHRKITACYRCGRDGHKQYNCWDKYPERTSEVGEDTSSGWRSEPHHAGCGGEWRIGPIQGRHRVRPDAYHEGVMDHNG